MVKNLILPHIRGVDVGANELMHRFSLNRNFAKLLANDKALRQEYTQYLGSMNVFEYSRGQEYHVNEIVWVRRSFGDYKLFLVRCAVETNTSDLQDIVDSAYVGGADTTPQFEIHGWKDENAFASIFDYGVDSRLRQYFQQKFMEHVRIEQFHRFGILPGDQQEIDKKLMLADLSNADSSRKNIFYPYYTRKIEKTESILYGFYRVWDNGTLEVDLVFRLGGLSDISKQDVIYCNTYNLLSSCPDGMTKYFNSANDRDILAQDSQISSTAAGLAQVGRNDYANVYSADIVFPRFTFKEKYISFKDANYMIFGSDVMSQDADFDKSHIEPSSNCMTFGNKTRKQFTAIYVTYPDNGNLDKSWYNAQNGGLVSNSFHCYIIGKWVQEQIQV